MRLLQETQMARVMEIVTPLGADVLLFHRMHANDEMSRLSEYEIDLLSAKGDVDLDQIVGDFKLRQRKAHLVAVSGTLHGVERVHP
jgi:uncharacterized protein involved in type VI secretion and phage assembly